MSEQHENKAMLMPDVSVANHSSTRASAATLDDVAGLLRGIRDTLTSQQAELLDAETAASMAGVSRATWDRMRSAGLVPLPVLLNRGSIIRWRRSELAAWIADGCPPQS